MRSVRAERPDFSTYVTGQAACLIDFQNRIEDRLPWALALIAIATFVLLFLMTGSVLVPVKALAMNALSLGATFGALVCQDGHFSGCSASRPTAPSSLVPIVVFVFAFGLSMDYEVFLLSRIKETYDESAHSDDAGGGHPAPSADASTVRRARGRRSASPAAEASAAPALEPAR